MTLCTVSPLTLAVYGIDYDTAGSALAKIHLGTYLVFTALIVVLGLAALARRLIQGRVFSLRKAAAILLILPLIGIGLAIMGETGLFDRMAEPTRRW